MKINNIILTVITVISLGIYSYAGGGGLLSNCDMNCMNDYSSAIDAFNTMAGSVYALEGPGAMMAIQADLADSERDCLAGCE